MFNFIKSFKSKTKKFINKNQETDNPFNILKNINFK